MDEALDAVVEGFVASLRSLRADGLMQPESLGNALSALVDFCITGIYTNGLIDDQAQFTQAGVRCGHGQVVFPYTWMCPICVAMGSARQACYLPSAERKERNGSVRDYPRVERLAKPGGRAIGDQGIQAVKALLRAVLRASGTGARLRDGGGSRGEFDLTVATDTALAFIEVKAKPLIAYPLLVDGEFAASEKPTPKHEWVSVKMESATRLTLLLGAINECLPLSAPSAANVKTWPLPDMARISADRTAVAKIIANWAEQASAYTQWTDEPDRLRWHRFGCGNFHVTEEDGTRVEKRVANTKELPGLDRTDDIKKGAAQVLKYSRLKFQCKKHALRAVLLGNTHALTHHDDYVAPILHLKVVDSESDPARAEWIFDAMIGLTRNQFNAPELAKLFAFSALLDEPLPPADISK